MGADRVHGIFRVVKLACISGPVDAKLDFVDVDDSCSSNCQQRFL